MHKQALLTDAAQSSVIQIDQSGSWRSKQKASDDARRIARVAVKHTLEEHLGRDGGKYLLEEKGKRECVDTKELQEEVAKAIKRLEADGTGLRDFANVAVGGQVVRSSSHLAKAPYWVLEENPTFRGGCLVTLSIDKVQG